MESSALIRGKASLDKKAGRLIPRVARVAFSWDCGVSRSMKKHKKKSCLESESHRKAVALGLPGDSGEVDQ
jgi:hypothetical protein